MAKISTRQQCVYEDPQRTWCAMLYRGVSMVSYGKHGITMVYRSVARYHWFCSTVSTVKKYHGTR